jgi:hypothetical protein
VPPHASSQQTPSTQCPDWHWDADVQEAPVSWSATHELALHHAAATHSTSEVHEAWQAVGEAQT